MQHERLPMLSEEKAALDALTMHKLASTVHNEGKLIAETAGRAA